MWSWSFTYDLDLGRITVNHYWRYVLQRSFCSNVILWSHSWLTALHGHGNTHTYTYWYWFDGLVGNPYPVALNHNRWLVDKLLAGCSSWYQRTSFLFHPSTPHKKIVLPFRYQQPITTSTIQPPSDLIQLVMHSSDTIDKNPNPTPKAIPERLLTMHNNKQ